MTYYEILEVSESASAEVIHMAYKALAKKYHPDKNPEDPTATQKFQMLRQAYETLSDPERRRRYDLLLTRQKTQTSSSPHTSNSQYAYGGQRTNSQQTNSYSRPSQPTAATTSKTKNQSMGKRLVFAFLILACLSGILFGGISQLNSEDTTCSHEWTAATCTEPKKCSLCGEETGTPLWHVTEEGVCRRCNQRIFGEPSDWDDDRLTFSEWQKKSEMEASGVGIRTITLADELTAEYVLAKIKQAHTESSVIDILDQYGSNQGGGKLYEVAPGDFVDECDQWCFDPSRQEGDCEIIETTYGYTILYFSFVLGEATPVLPVSGTVFIGKNLPTISELTINTSSCHCYVKLKDENLKDVFSFFVRANDSITVPVPSGYYYVYFASGNEWCGLDLLFGDSTSYSKDNEILDFENYAWEYTLTEVVNGNFSETPISPNEF